VKMIVTCQPGKEKRVLADLLDALFPYDTSVKGDVKAPGRIIVETRLPPSSLRSILVKYPIRGLRSVKVILSYYRNWEELLRNIAGLLERRGVFVKKISVNRVPGWRQENYYLLKKSLKKLFNKQNGSIITIEEVEGKIAVEVILFRLTYDSFSHHAKI